MTRPDRACALALGRVERNAAQRSAAQLSPVPQAGQEFPSLSRVFILHSFIRSAAYESRRSLNFCLTKRIQVT